MASQAGHLLVYQIRFGPAALSLQSSGAHAYFPVLAKTGLGIAAAGMIAGLLIVGLARVVSGRRVGPESAPSYLRLLAGLFTIQLALYCLQETIEAQLSGRAPGSSTDLVMFGAAGQVPAAASAALALRWLFTEVRPALRLLVVGFAQLEQPLWDVLLARAPVFVPLEPSFVADATAMPVSRRGPPRLLR